MRNRHLLVASLLAAVYLACAAAPAQAARYCPPDPVLDAGHPGVIRTAVVTGTILCAYARLSADQLVFGRTPNGLGPVRPYRRRVSYLAYGARWQIRWRCNLQWRDNADGLPYMVTARCRGRGDTTEPGAPRVQRGTMRFRATS
jgi:hypothetical protein